MDSGFSMPFDPRASKLAARLKLKVVMINGKNLERLEDFLNNKPFIGTSYTMKRRNKKNN